MQLLHISAHLRLRVPGGLLFASALGGASLTIPLWAMVLIGLAGAAIFVLGMRYGDRLERAILKRLGKE